MTLLALLACSPSNSPTDPPAEPTPTPPDVRPLPRPVPPGPVDFDRPLVARLNGGEVLFAPHPDGVLVAVGVREVEVWPCTRTGDELACGSGDLWPGTWPCQVDALEFALADTDGDGSADGGEVHWVGVCGGGCSGASNVDDFVPLGVDTVGAPAAWQPVLFPWEPVRIELAEPADLGAPPVLTVGPDPLPLEPELGPAGVPLAWTSAPAVLPWDLPLVLAVPPSDLAGNPMPLGAASIPPDPGPWTGNPGFELVEGGWVVRGANLGPFAPYQAAEGTGFARISGGGDLATVLAVPEAGGTLRFAFTLGDGPGFPQATASIVEAGGARQTVWQLEWGDGEGCPAFGCPWEEVDVDLTPWAGTTVFLELSNPQPQPVYCSEFTLWPAELWIDDVRLE